MGVVCCSSYEDSADAESALTQVTMWVYENEVVPNTLVAVIYPCTQLTAAFLSYIMRGEYVHQLCTNPWFTVTAMARVFLPLLAAALLPTYVRGSPDSTQPCHYGQCRWDYSEDANTFGTIRLVSSIDLRVNIASCSSSSLCLSRGRNRAYPT